jgi:hypothetical protein
MVAAVGAGYRSARLDQFLCLLHSHALLLVANNGGLLNLLTQVLDSESDVEALGGILSTA